MPQQQQEPMMGQGGGFWNMAQNFSGMGANTYGMQRPNVKQEETPPGHTVGGAIESGAGLAIAGSQAGSAIGGYAAGSAAGSTAASTAKGASVGGWWGAAAGAVVGILSYLFS